MAAIDTPEGIVTLRPTWSSSVVRRSVRMYDSFNYDYATLYRIQPNVRTCVDFLARNIAQLGLHTFRRISDTDRVRLLDHALPKLLATPVPAEFKITRYRLIESLISDLGIYFNAYWLKLRRDGTLRGILRIPPIYMNVTGGLAPTGYEMTIGGRRWTLSPDQVVHFRGYNPEDPISGLSPLETLRRILAEEHAAGKYREEFWENSARIEGIVKRPATAPEWSDTARERFIAEFSALYSGDGTGGKTAVLEDGMEWQPATFNPKESEYLAGRKLTREECARAYHIPLPMVGILDHATFSNIAEQHKNLYQDSLGPWLVMVEQDIELQLLPDLEDSDGVYVEFNINEKLAGSFEEQTKSLQSAVGRPWMTANEARARMNLPRSEQEDADLLVTPLNVLAGGLASPRDSASPKTKAIGAAPAGLRERYEQKWTEALIRHYRRQEASVVSRVPKALKDDIGGLWWDADRWDAELSADLFNLNRLTALTWSQVTIEQGDLQVDDMEAFESIMLPWLQEHSRVQASNINTRTQEALTGALRQPEALEAVKNVFVLATTIWAASQAATAVTTASNFGSMEAARAGGLRQKRWRVTSGNPRPSHAAIDGEVVGIRQTFSNGLRWPGDPAGSADDNAGCRCIVEFL